MSAFLPSWEIEPLILRVEAEMLMDECERVGREKGDVDDDKTR